jgi:mannose-6-phosphate isomerase
MRIPVTEIPLYPLRFAPIYQYRLWGGRRFEHFLRSLLPPTTPVGEAWILSDRADHPSLVADGPLQGATIAQLLQRSPQQMLGKLAGHFSRFPVLLKFLDVHEKLSVQVHPSDIHSELIPPGETGKTESWVVLETGSQGQIYAGLKSGTTAETLRGAVADKTVAKHLAGFTPRPGDCVLVPAGTVHALGDVMVFEVQQNSDVTFRLDDWNHIDSKTGNPRPLQIEQAMACIDFDKVDIGPVVPEVEETKPVLREKLIPLSSVKKRRRLFSSVWLGEVRWNTRVTATPSTKGTCCSCPPSWGDVAVCSKARPLCSRSVCRRWERHEETHCL